MITFPCTCGRQFSFPDDMAGGFTQCPDCKRLVDIPTLSDLSGLADDGTIKMQEVAPQPVDDPARISELHEAFSRKVRDEQGVDYDLRPTWEQIENAGADDVPLALKDELLPGAPKYDPETGEIVQPLDIQPDILTAQRAVKAVPVQAVAYANRETEPAHQALFLQLLMPANIIVLFVIFLFDVVGHFLAWNFIIFRAFIPPLFVIIMAHYANVIYDTGVEGKNDLPRPLRDLNYWDDIALPFFQVVFCLMICFFPVIAVYPALLPSLTDLAFGYDFESRFRSPRFFLSLAMFCAGAFLLPAMLLTICTSGAVQNLRPDRLFGVIKQCGPAYLAVFILSLLSAAAYFITTFGHEIFPRLVFIFPAIFLATYITHLFTWKLGELYRAHHDKFPWVLQRHVRSPLAQRIAAPSRRPRRVSSANVPGSRPPMPRPNSVPPEQAAEARIDRYLNRGAPRQ